MRAWRRLAFAACLIVASCALPRCAVAQNGGPSDLSDAEIARRLGFVEHSLDAHRRQVWFWSWMTVNVGSTVSSASAPPRRTMMPTAST